MRIRGVLSWPMGSETTPTIRQVVFDTEDARGLAEFYRQLFGLDYRPGDEVLEPGEDWLVLRNPGGSDLAFQQVAHLPRPTWPEGPLPQMLHLDTTVPTLDELYVQRDRALRLGATLLRDRADDAHEPLYVLADPSGHPFCIFVAD
jgi:hypothetical protein